MTQVKAAWRNLPSALSAEGAGLMENYTWWAKVGKKRKSCQTRNWDQGKRRSQAALVYIQKGHVRRRAALMTAVCSLKGAETCTCCRQSKAEPLGCWWGGQCMWHRWRKKEKRKKEIHIGSFFTVSWSHGLFTYNHGNGWLSNPKGKLGGI